MRNTKNHTRIASWLLVRSNGCPRGATRRLWAVTIVVAAIASQLIYSLTNPIPGPAAISLLLALVLLVTAVTVLYQRVTVPLERAIAERIRTSR
jgi:hypothetical protein